MDLPPTTCHYCTKPAIAFCDFVVDHGGGPRGRERPVQTCDRAICADHCRRVGHVCARGRNKKLSDTIDHCKEHDPP